VRGFFLPDHPAREDILQAIKRALLFYSRLLWGSELQITFKMCIKNLHIAHFLNVARLPPQQVVLQFPQRLNHFRGYVMINMKSSMKQQSGFTLIEIAIVLVIIGLLLGGVLQGQQLIENSRVRAASNDFDGIPAAIFSYRDRYGRLPGDDGPTATLTGRGASWAGITASATALNGILNSTAAQTFTGAGENGLMFQMLRAAGFIPGNPANTLATALPSNPFGGLTSVAQGPVMPAVAATGLNGNLLCMSNVPGTAAIALDTQMDDGVGTTGRFRATLGGGVTVPGAAIAAAYTEDSFYTVCYRI